MSGIKTGVGGFEIDGKIHEFDVGDPESPGEPDSSLPNPDTGDIKVDNSKKDISKGTKTTLSKYLKTLTSNNSFPIDGSYHDTKITDANGAPHPISQDKINDAEFVKRSAISGVSTSANGDPSTTLSNLSKGKTAPLVDPQKISERKDGHTLLPSVEKDKLPSVIKNYTSTVLSVNRFNSAAQSAAEISGNGTKFTPDGDYNPTLHHPRYGDVTIKRLAQVGTALSLRASQELNAASAGNNPTSGAQEAAALLPGFNQLGTSRIEVAVLEARDLLETLTTEEVPDGTISSISDLSWGSMNNVDDPFSGISAIGMIGLSVALTAAVTLLFEGLGFLLTMIKGGSTGAARNISGRYVLGRHTVTKQSDPNAFPPSFPPDISALLGIRATTFPLGSALKKGTASFFGIDDSGGLESRLISGLNSAASAPGFNAVVCRTIIRSSLTVIDSFKKAFSSSNVVSGIKNILGIVEIIRQSKLIAAINIFAMLGDQILTQPNDVPTDAIPEEPKKLSYIDSQPEGSPAESVRKNRISKTLKLAWASNRAPAMYLVPDSILTMQAADQKLGAFKGPAGLTDDNSKTTFKVLSSEEQKNGARISRNNDVLSDKDTVKNFEAQLDAEYVPFSFHDLRTNEIISFHAFLASLADDYNANYETVEGYGRVDPVKIYKSTQRKLSMSFYVAATSEQDFDDMWLKINKLTTMLYPQYTRGRMLINKDKNIQFVQPFSQLIGASPVIRLRLGDLIKTNYSRFALARLFGLGGTDTIKLGKDGDNNIDIKPFSGGSQKLKDYREKIKNLAINGDTTVTFNMNSDGWPKSADGGLSIPLPIGGGTDKPQQSPVLRIDFQDAPYVVLMIKQLRGDVADCVVSLMEPSDIVQQYGMSELRANEISAYLIKKYDETDNMNFKIKGPNPYTVPVRMLKPTNKTIKDVYNKMFGEEQKDIDKISKFLDIKDNALMKSFNSIQGKGLAGVIESMNFDWFDKVIWETIPGSTAPKLCKVTLTFAPIHDISPGIDHMGYNRAPIYGVGAAMRQGNDPERSGE